MFANSGKNPSTTDEDFDSEKDSSDEGFEEDPIIKKLNLTVTSLNSMPSSDSEQVILLPNEIVLFDENGKIERTTVKALRMKPDEDNEDQDQDATASDRVGLYRVQANDVSLFFSELLGGLYGLVYGAAAQINRTIGAAKSPTK
ncbi:hypothetical protein HHI36_000248 [Cryptolaemus montrouzieri]|uniref:Uncharacterized protein n=1 Tax=Cryptolaemus montrouzieri TaxID=559131 RepID=A0ABD2P4F3_9CUCU